MQEGFAAWQHVVGAKRMKCYTDVCTPGNEFFCFDS